MAKVARVSLASSSGTDRSSRLAVTSARLTNLACGEFLARAWIARSANLRVVDDKIRFKPADGFESRSGVSRRCRLAAMPPRRMTSKTMQRQAGSHWARQKR